MKPTLQLKVSQQLALTPQLQQSIKLLQLSSLDLQSEIERLLLENPLLERSDEFNDEGYTYDISQPESVGENTSEQNDERVEGGEVADLSDWGSGRAGGSNDEDESFDPILNVVSPVSLRQHLLNQLGELSLPERDRAIVTLLIEELDDNGYLTTGLEEIADNLPLELNVEVDELSVGLALLQQFDPAGVGSGNLSESLILQLKRQSENTPGWEMALQIAGQYLTLLGQRDFNRLKKVLRTDDDGLRCAQTLIASLNPYPSSGYAEGETHYIVPDILVKRRGDRWQAELNQGAIPRLRVNQMYARAVAEQRRSAGELTGQLQEAKWLIKNLQQRFDTILRVAEAIVEEQQTFFEKGEIAMRPLILRSIAEQLNLHESTISRVTSQKYLLCPRGLFELKYFFGSSLDTDSGEECSATAIKARIKQMIESETPNKPLSDGAIAEALVAQGIQVARRTVAKYREAMQIPSTSQRKRL